MGHCTVPWKREPRAFLSFGLIGGGIILLLVPFWTWLYGFASQAALEAKAQGRRATVVAGIYDNQAPVQEGREHAETGNGKAGKAGAWPLTRLVIPKLGLEAVVVEGVDEASLRRGPGHYPGTALPGEEGNVGIAGHRNAWGRWFRNLHRLEPGDAVFLVTETATYWYRVTDKWVTHAYDWSVVEPTPSPSLTLTTCELPVQSKKRLIVRAVLVSPAGPNRQGR